MLNGLYSGIAIETSSIRGSQQGDLLPGMPRQIRKIDGVQIRTYEEDYPGNDR